MSYSRSYKVCKGVPSPEFVYVHTVRVETSSSVRSIVPFVKSHFVGVISLYMANKMNMIEIKYILKDINYAMGKTFTDLTPNLSN